MKNRRQCLLRLMLFMWCMNLVPGFVKAQSSQKFTAFTELGILAGASGPAAAVQAGAGMRFKTFSLYGAGGLDTYRFTTIPAFIQARKAWKYKKLAPFAALSCGLNLPAGNLTTNDDEVNIFWPGANTNSKFSAGYYAEIRGGVGIRFKKEQRFYTSLGYNHKSIVERYDTRSWQNSEYFEVKNHFILRRLALQFGYEF